jgi:hypothetical protein
MMFGEQNRCLCYSSPAAIMGKKKGNQFRGLRELLYFSLNKECASRNMKIYTNIFSILLYGFPFCFTAHGLKIGF